MIYLKKGIFWVAIALILSSCSKGERKIVSTYDNGQPFIAEYLKKSDGKLKKTYEEHFYENGNLRAEGKFSNDKKDGIWKFYYEDGSLFAQTDFSQAQEGKFWQVYLNKDSLLADKKDSLISIAFSEEGTPVTMRLIHNGNEVFYRFFNSFKIMECVFLKGNVPQGEARSWFENGNLNSVRFYKDGLPDSLCTVYAESGKRIMTGTYNKGKKTGTWEYYASDGRALGTETFDANGVKLSETDNQGLHYSTVPVTDNRGK